MSAPGKIFPRALIYGLIFYLIGDLLILHGPLRARIDLLNPNSAASIAKAKSLGIVARVSGQSITRSQLDRAISGQLWLAGKPIGFLNPKEQENVRSNALWALIDHELLSGKIRTGEKPPSVTPEEITARIQNFTARFENKDSLESTMKSQGIRNDEDLKTRIATELQQEKFIESQIAPQIKVTEEEAREWFTENEKSLANPERLEARHIFIPTLDHPPEEAKQKLDEALAALTEKKKDFTTLAKEISEDPATKDNGGALGWMTYARLPVDFASPLFSLELNKPALIRSRLGWHLAEVTAKKAAEPRAFEQAKPEILSAMAAFKRHQAVSDFRNSLRKSEAKNIEIFQDMIPD